MRATQVDPRDTRWETARPDYRVYFWSTDGHACDEYELTDALDVHEVLAWASTHAAGRLPEVFVCVKHLPEGLGLVRLIGARP